MNLTPGAGRGGLEGAPAREFRTSKKSRAKGDRAAFGISVAGDDSGRDGAYFNITNNPRWLSVSLDWPEPSCVSVNTRTFPSGLAKPEIVVLFEPTMVTPPVAVTL